jgi:hypothetical protein
MESSAWWSLRLDAAVHAEEFDTERAFCSLRSKAVRHRIDLCALVAVREGPAIFLRKMGRPRIAALGAAQISCPAISSRHVQSMAVTDSAFKAARFV